MKNRAVVQYLRVTGLLGFAVVVLFSSHAVAQQSCGAEMGTSIDPTTPLQVGDLPELVKITVSPTSDPDQITFNMVDYALACRNNDDEVPCTFGNDSGATTGEVPVEFVEVLQDESTCGEGGQIQVDNPGALGAGTVRFTFDDTTVQDGAGCSVVFNVRVLDRGTDDTPNELTGAVLSEGQCTDSLFADAQGSTTIRLEDDPPPPPRAVPGLQGWWLALMAALMLLPVAGRLGRGA